MKNKAMSSSNIGSGPTKQDIEAVFNRLRLQPANKVCFDCPAKAPTWSSVTYGIFICIDCSAVHRNLGVHLTFVRSTNLDTNWTWSQLRQMQLGGNANAAQFFRQHNCVTTDAEQKYNSRAAQLYRDKLANMANQAMKLHGTKLHLDANIDKLEGNENSKSAANVEEDFFAQCANDNNFGLSLNNNNTDDNKASMLNKIELTTTTSKSTEKLDCGMASAPSVDLLNSTVPSSTTLTPSIGVRKIQPKKSGMGARKSGGLGATKVKTNFAEIEQRANLATQSKDGNAFETISNASNSSAAMTAEKELETVASMRLAYQDLSLQKNREEAKLKNIDPAKAKQMERLGMGFNLRGSADISHSAISDMETIQQQSASAKQQGGNKTTTSLIDNDNFFNDYSPSMYSGGGGGGGSSFTSKADKRELELMGFETIEPIDSNHGQITSMFNASSNDETKSASKSAAAKALGYDKSYERKNTSTSKVGDNNDFGGNAAQKKFGGAKGFGSDQYFGNEQSNDQDTRSANLSRFQGSNSISSADYFGDGMQSSNRNSRGGYSTAGGVNFQTPDLDDVKDSVRQGVHKVAGRISQLATDVMSSLQDKYGY